MNILFLVGLVVFLGIISGKLFQKLHIPQVVGYILLGVIVGKSSFHIVEGPTVNALMTVVNFTLGIIGFIIGGELKADIFKRYGKSIYAILLGEGLFAFLFVAVTISLITHKLYLGLIFGAIASATDPASTMNVLWEYRSKGPLTTTLSSIVALDDGLALLIYGFAVVFSKALLAREQLSFLHSFAGPLWEIVQCLLLGAIAGLIVSKAVVRVREKDLAVAFMLGAIAIVAGTAMWFDLDLILCCMALGMTVTNVIPKKSEKLFFSIKEMSVALYILFFVVVGAQLDVSIFLKTSLFLLICGYLFARSLGKVLGAYCGGIVSHARMEVTRYTGLGLFTQGGVAMGLALSIAHNISSISPEGQDASILIMSVVTTTTFIVQLFGPSCVKYSIFKADEAYKNLTKDDVIESLTVKDVMQKAFAPVPESAPLSEVIRIIKSEEAHYLPVVDAQNKTIGSVSLNNIKEALLEEELNRLLVARDIAVPDRWTIAEDQPLQEAIRIFEERYLDYLPVIKNEGSGEVIGILEHQRLAEAINRELLIRQRAAE